MPDRGRGLAQPSCGVGVVRSFFQRKSHSAPAVRLLGLCPGPPLHDKKAQDGQITIIKVPGLGCWRAETIPVEGLRPLLGMED